MELTGLYSDKYLLIYFICVREAILCTFLSGICMRNIVYHRKYYSLSLFTQRSTVNPHCCWYCLFSVRSLCGHIGLEKEKGLVVCALNTTQQFIIIHIYNFAALRQLVSDFSSRRRYMFVLSISVSQRIKSYFRFGDQVLPI